MRGALWVLLSCVVAITACSEEPQEPVPVALLTDTTPPLKLPWSELSGRIAYSINNQIYLIDSRLREVRLFASAKLPEATAFPSRLNFSPVGARMAAEWITGNSVETRVFAVQDGFLIQVLGATKCMHWLADYTYLYIRRDTLFINERPSGVLNTVGCPSTAPDSTYMVFNSYVPNLPLPVELVRLDLKSGQRARIEARPLQYSAVDVSPDSKSIAYVYSVGLTNELRVASADGSNNRLVTTFTSVRPWYIAWSPNSKEILVPLSDGLYIVDAASGATRQVLNFSVNQIGWGP
jgi:hypothetical protein